MEDFNPFDCLKWAADHQCGGHGPAKLVLLILAGYAGYDQRTGEWSCYPSQETIAKRALQSTRSVRRNLGLLDGEVGAITRIPMWNKQGQPGRATDRYVLHVGLPANLSGKDSGLPDTAREVTGHQPRVNRTTEVGLPDTSVQGTTRELPEELPERTIPRDDAAFAEFWSVYPKKASKGDARTAFKKALKKAGSLELVVAGATRYRDDPNRLPEFTKDPQRWLRGECWEDDPLPSRTNSNNTRTHQPIEEWWDRSEPSGELEL